MRKLRIFEHLSLDGILQAPGARDEDGDYPYGGWAVPYRDPAGGKAVFEAHVQPFDLLLGRRTYDIWSAFWPTAPQTPMAEKLNAATKYVVTHRPDTLQWEPFQSLGPDFLADLRRLKASEGPDLILWGSSSLTSLLLQHGIAEELMLFLYPLLLGEGKRLFADGPPTSLRLTGSTALPTGVLIHTYTPATAPAG